MQPGEYDLYLAADCGPRAGAETTGHLTLVRAERNHERASQPSFRGWTDVHFERVGASLCSGEVPPDSHDPRRPGVLLLEFIHGQDIDPTLDMRGPVFWIGTNFNSGDEWSTDGCGIALAVDRWDGRCYRGHWDRAGIVDGGAGAFAMCPRRSP